MNFADGFGRWERILHRLAFRTTSTQLAVADMENTLLRGRMPSVPSDRPVFISGLPRSGTTILLELLVNTGAFASHTYRDMPFIFCPLVWSRFSEHFSADTLPRERAHGDGVEVSSSSPEAFEEMIWKQFWKDKYAADRILPWTLEDCNPSFDKFFELHMAKVIAIRSNGVPDLRYLSKNNVNIARIANPPKPLRRGTVLIPFREPLQHAASLHRQHLRFSALQRQDPFALEYMGGIGHHDFGLALRPIDFGEWLREAGSPIDLEFWLRYWQATYRHILGSSSSRTLISFERLCSDPESTLRRVASAVEVRETKLLRSASRLRTPDKHPIDTDSLCRELLAETREIYDELSLEAAR